MMEEVTPEGATMEVEVTAAEAVMMEVAMEETMAGVTVVVAVMTVVMMVAVTAAGIREVNLILRPHLLLLSVR